MRGLLWSKVCMCVTLSVSVCVYMRVVHPQLWRSLSTKDIRFFLLCDDALFFSFLLFPLPSPQDFHVFEKQNKKTSKRQDGVSQMCTSAQSCGAACACAVSASCFTAPLLPSGMREEAQRTPPEKEVRTSRSDALAPLASLADCAGLRGLEGTCQVWQRKNEMLLFSAPTHVCSLCRTKWKKQRRPRSSVQRRLCVSSPSLLLFPPLLLSPCCTFFLFRSLSLIISKCNTPHLFFPLFSRFVGSSLPFIVFSFSLSRFHLLLSARRTFLHTPAASAKNRREKKKRIPTGVKRTLFFFIVVVCSVAAAAVCAFLPLHLSFSLSTFPP